ncbi:putative C6 transcription factor [Xylogone sp. PMI_703]|nr:putative C6 transcription factor [Xylogone sp. PMI_703]KAH8800677.1 putative C6 transcription factor [Xylogone sp. PMI_703]
MPSSSGSSGAGSTTAPAAPKLRDSCEACAASKVRCNKVKPSCFRCTKRGLNCEYLATKRVGRKHYSRPSVSDRSNTPTSTANTINVTQSPSISDWFVSNSAIPQSDGLPSPSVTDPSSLKQTSGASSDIFSNAFSPEGQSLTSVITDLTSELDDFFTLTTELDDFLAAPLALSVPDTSDSDILSQVRFFSSAGAGAGTDSGSSNCTTTFLDVFPGFQDTVSELSSLSRPRSPLNRSPSTSDSCGCLFQALDLMKQLFPDSSACSISTPQGADKPAALPTIQAVIAKNEATIIAVGTMLQCSCSQDGYLLAIISLIVFKVLGWYAAAARKTPSSTDSSSGSRSPSVSSMRQSPHSEQVLQNPAIVGSYCLDGEDGARMAAQLVLSELHCVRRLVNQLSSKLKVQVVRKGGGADTSNSSGCVGADSETALPLSAVMLSQLEVDLRKRLRTLSSEIVEFLRRE